MSAVEFCYWLQGAFEILDPKELDEKQVNMIKAHLRMAFYYDIDKTYPENEQKTLSDIHEAGKSVGKPLPQFSPKNSNGIDGIVRC